MFVNFIQILIQLSEVPHTSFSLVCPQDLDLMRMGSFNEAYVYETFIILWKTKFFEKGFKKKMQLF